MVADQGRLLGTSPTACRPIGTSAVISTMEFLVQRTNVFLDQFLPSRMRSEPCVHGTPRRVPQMVTDTTLVILCPYCMVGIESRPMTAYKDGRFVCRDCARTVRPGTRRSAVLEYHRVCFQRHGESNHTQQRLSVCKKQRLTLSIDIFRSEMSISPVSRVARGVRSGT